MVMTAISTDNVLVQLHRALVDALILSDRHSVHDAVTVAEIYQDLIPYRSVRTLGFALNADYEHVLLRLLAGESGLVRIEPDQARERIREELESTNPNVGIYRNYAACDVFVTLPDDLDITAVPAKLVEAPMPEPKSGPAADGSHASGGPNEAGSEAIETIRDFAARTVQPDATPAPTAATAPSGRPAATPPPQSLAASRAETTATNKPGPCKRCSRALPAGRSVVFCPFCGTDQRVRNCESCQEELEDDWVFCVACGTAVK
jgi:hypothetical protein